MSAAETKPVQPGERINEIDIIRGFALLGILMVNMSYFKYVFLFERYPTYFPEGIERVSGWFIQLLFTGKFYAIFSFLFGLGFYIFMERTLSRGHDLIPLYRRRLLALMVIGILHLTLFWYGDILFLYALGGFILLKFRNLSLLSIKKWVIGLMIVVTVFFAVQGLMEGGVEYYMGEEYDSMMAGIYKEAIEIYSTGSFFEVAAFRVANETPYMLMSLIVMIPAVVAFFLCGLYAGKTGIFKNISGNKELFKKICTRGYPLGALFLLLYIVVEAGILEVHSIAGYALLNVSNYIASIFLFAAYISTLLLALQNGAFRKLLSPLAATGRMALTNYLSQTIICVLIFNGFGLGLFGTVSLTGGILLTLGIFAAQVIWSNLWMSKYSYGPMEWLWRMITYKKIQPLKKT